MPNERSTKYASGQPGRPDQVAAALLRHKITMSGLIALCGLALLVQYVFEPDPAYTGAHLIAGLLMLTLAVIVWCLPSEPE